MRFIFPIDISLDLEGDPVSVTSYPSPRPKVPKRLVVSTPNILSVRLLASSEEPLSLAPP